MAGDDRSEEAVELAIVTMRFDAADADGLMAVLSKYVVLARMQPGCRNIDLCASVTQPGRYLVIHKWDSVAAQRAHFDSDVMVEMATVVQWAPDLGSRHRSVGRRERARPPVAAKIRWRVSPRSHTESRQSAVAFA